MIPPYLFQQVDTAVPDFLSTDRSSTGEDGGRGQGLPRGRRERRRRRGLIGHEQRVYLTSFASMMSTVRIQAEVLLWVFLADAVARVIVERSSRVLLKLLLLPDAGQVVPVSEYCESSSSVMFRGHERWIAWYVRTAVLARISAERYMPPLAVE